MTLFKKLIAVRGKKISLGPATNAILAPEESILHGAIGKERFSIVIQSVIFSLLLGAVTFLIYWPSLKSDFVYDARVEIEEEDFVTSLSNLPEVLSLHVLYRDDVMLAQRPGEILYLMLNAAIWGRTPFGYHLSSNFLHAANVALLYILLSRLIVAEMVRLSKGEIFKIQAAAAAVTLIFALHPIAVESVAEVSYSSSLLVTFFSLVSLLMATSFRPDKFRTAMLTGTMGTLSALASVLCKESGVVTALLLVTYWFLFRRRETKRPWFWFLGAAMTVTTAFLAARFYLAAPNPNPLGYLGGSFSQVFLIQPRLWGFMMEKLLWPAQLSGDYMLQDVLQTAFSTALAFLILVMVGLLQTLLTFRSQIGALGVIIYWLGLSTVSNFVPLYHPLADRYYYLPLVGVSIQIFAVFLVILRWRFFFWVGVGSVLLVIPPLMVLTLARQDVFSASLAFWSETLRVSPSSFVAAKGVGDELFDRNDLKDSIAYYNQAIKLNSRFTDAYSNRGFARYVNGQPQEALNDFYTSLEVGSGHVDGNVRLYIWLIRAVAPDQLATANQMIIANEELKDYIDNYSDRNNRWVVQVGRFLLGDISQADLLKAACSSNEWTAQKRHCEAYFYVGIKQALSGDRASAHSFMLRCIGTNVPTWTEYKSASLWLKNDSSR